MKNVVSVIVILCIISPTLTAADPYGYLGSTNGWQQEGDRIRSHRLENIRLMQEFLNSRASAGIVVSEKEAKDFEFMITGGDLMFQGLVTPEILEAQRRMAEAVQQRNAADSLSRGQ